MINQLILDGMWLRLEPLPDLTILSPRLCFRELAEAPSLSLPIALHILPVTPIG